MASKIIPAHHFFKGPTLATPQVFNRVFNDINNAASRLFQGGVACAAEMPVILVNSDDQISVSAVNIHDITFWPSTVDTDVDLVFEMVGTSKGEVSLGVDGKGGYGVWVPGGSAFDYDTIAADPEEVSVKMTATYKILTAGDDTFSGETGEDTFTLSCTAAQLVSGSVMVFVNDTQEDDFTIEDNTVVLGTPLASDQEVMVIYDYNLTYNQSYTTTFTVLAEPAAGTDAVTNPIPRIESPATVCPMYSDGSTIGARFKLIDVSNTKPGDDIYSQWQIFKSDDTEITNNTALCAYEGTPELGSVSTPTDGDDEIVVILKEAGSYYAKLSVLDDTLGVTNTVTVDLQVLPFWSFQPVMLMSSNPTSIGAPLSGGTWLTAGTMNDMDNSYYTGINRPYQAQQVVVRFGCPNVGSDTISAVTDNGNGTFTIEINNYFAAFAGTNKPVVADIRPGVDYFWYKGAAYNIHSIAEQGDTSVVISTPSGTSDPTTGWAGESDFAIGTTADRFILLIEVKDGSNNLLYEKWQEVIRRSGTPEYEARFDIPYGTTAHVSVWGGYGSNISTVSNGSLVIADTENVPAAVEISASEQAYGLIVSWGVNDPESIVHHYEVGWTYSGDTEDLTMARNGTHPLQETTQKKFVIPSTTAVNVIYTVLAVDNYGRRQTWTPGVSVPEEANDPGAA